MELIVSVFGYSSAMAPRTSRAASNLSSSTRICALFSRASRLSACYGNLFARSS